MCVCVSPNRFICRGSGGLGRGAVFVYQHRGAKWLLKFVVKTTTKLMFPSKTQCFLILFHEKHDYSREWHQFIRLQPLRLPWGRLGSPGLPDASKMPPRCLPDGSQMPPDGSQLAPLSPQMAPRWLQDVSHMAPRCLPDAFQMAHR